MKQVLQRDYKDCGISCLSYIIQFYKGYVPFMRLREDTHTDGNGCSAYDLVETLKKYQFDAYGLQTNYEGMHHFVVLTKITDNKVSIMDPAYGNRHLSKREFSAIFDGVVLVAIPHALIPRLPKSKSIQKELFGLLKNEKTSFLFLVILSIFIVILAIFYELYFKVGVMYGTILEEKKFKVFLSFFLVLLLTKLVLLFLKNKWKLSFDKNIDIRYLYAFVSHILKIPLTKFQTFHEGELITRVEEAKEMKDLF